MTPIDRLLHRDGSLGRFVMPLGLEHVSRITKAWVARHCAARVQVDGVAHSRAASEFAEVLLTVWPAGATDRRGPRTLLVQVRRTNGAAIEEDLRVRVARALRPRPRHDDD